VDHKDACKFFMKYFLNINNFKRSVGAKSWGYSSQDLCSSWLEDRGSIVGRDNGFFPSLCVQTSSGAHPASCPMGTRGPFPGAKHSRGVTLTTHPNLLPRSRMSRSYTPHPLIACMEVTGHLYFTFNVVSISRKVRCIELISTVHDSLEERRRHRLFPKLVSHYVIKS
jgi:hypothetical protein